jgi:hypothetical protein
MCTKAAHKVSLGTLGRWAALRPENVEKLKFESTTEIGRQNCRGERQTYTGMK